MDRFCGKRATVYSVILNDEGQTLFDQFIVENQVGYKRELGNILDQILTISKSTGIRENFFYKPEGKIGQDIWALYDKPEAQLRLYCMQLGHAVIILGGGGPKPKNIRALQEDPKLKLENDLMRMVSDALTKRMIRDKEIEWSKDKTELIGDLKFNTIEDLDGDD